MENILSHIQNWNTKSEIGFLVRQTRKYRKKSGKTSKYISHAYMYHDWIKYKKLYVRKDDVEIIRDEIVGVKKSIDKANSYTRNLIKKMHTYVVIQNQIYKELEMNPEKYTYRAKLSIINKFTGVWM